ncbi:PAS domain-containing protein [Mucilaginibacter robiniae]|uniref:histidine kinase n=1 Tax=Mucilaginibacter robiniae TaxID=2728022 RepID=A0A7L5E5B5_9SPHI|nr:PAS domain-containing protein [Mucilaginibacter robiniae]QJD96033.1 PAS domain-containing protein [Mucilaginibacter robiniae]
MSQPPAPYLGSNELLDVLTRSKDATAIYSSEDLHISFVSDAMLRIWGKDRSVVGKTFEQALPEIVGQPFTRLLQMVWRTGETYTATDTPATLEIEGILTTSYFDFEYRAFRNASGETYCLLHTATDVSERVTNRRAVQEATTQLHQTQEGLHQSHSELNEVQQAARQLRAQADESEFKYRSVIDQSPAAIIIFRGPELYIDAANAPMLQLLDQPATIIGHPLLTAIPELAGQPACELLYDIYKTGKPAYGYETPVQLKRNGQVETSYFNFSYTPLIEGGQITGIVDMAVEVTEQVKARHGLEQALAAGRALANKLTESESRLQSIINTMAEGMGIINNAGDIVFVNPMAQRILGLHTDEITQRTYGDARWQNLRLDGTLLPDEEHPMAVMMAAQKPVYDMEIGVQPPDAERFYISINAAPLYDADGNLNGGVATFMDVTQRRKMLNQLTESESRFRKLVEQAPVAILVFRGEAMVFDVVNDNMLKVLGKDKSIVGRTLLEGLPEIAGQPVLDALYRVYHTGEPFTGHDIPVNLNRNGKSEECYFNVSYTPLFEGDRITGVLEVASEVTVQVLAHKAVEQAEEQLRLAIASAELGTWSINAETRQFIPSPRLKELFGYHPNEEMPYEAALDQVAADHRARVSEAVEAAITHNESYELEYPIIGYHDGKERWVRATGRLYAATSSSAAHFSGTIQDITDRKLDEQRRLDFIGIVSHELRSPLTSLNGYVQMLSLKAKKDEDLPGRDILVKAQRQIDRMRSLISGFLDVARIGEGKIQLNCTCFDMAELVKQAEEESLATVTSHRVIFHPVEHTPVKADRDKIEQVLLNFINNAVKYSPQGSDINVSCTSNGPTVKVCVSDQGMGIAPPDQPHVFGRFYRVESERMKLTKGFGIGLYICKEIIEKHHGSIGVNSVPDKGSEFWFELPL